MNNQSDKSQVVTLSSNCVVTYKKHTEVYKNILKTGQPKPVEKVMSALGFRRKVNMSRAQRLGDVSNLVDQGKNEATVLLSEAISQAEIALLTTQSLLKDTSQTVAVNKARLKLKEAQLNQVKSTCGSSIDRVKQYLLANGIINENFSLQSRDWLEIDSNDVEGFFESLSFGEEIEIKEEWRGFIKALQDLYGTKDSINKAQQQRRLAYAVEQKLEKYLESWKKEFSSVNTDFEFIKLSIQSGQIKNLDELLDQKLASARALDDFIALRDSK